jgi:hypothetical protein
MHHDQCRDAEIKSCAFVREVLIVQPGRPALPVAADHVQIGLMAVSG